MKGIRSTNPVAVGDYVQIIVNAEGTAFISEIEDRRNYVIRKASNLSNTGKDYPLIIGSGTFIPGFEEALVGLKASDKKDVALQFPKDYHAKDLAGADVVFETTIKKINKIELPELNDEFAAKTDG